VPFAFGRLAALAAQFRDASRRKIQDAASRRRFWKRVIDGPVADLVFAGREDEAARMLERDLGSGGASTGTEGTIYLIDAGAGDPELLTLRALRVLQTADVVLYDSRVSRAILDLARREAEKIDVAYEAAVELALREARAGRRVVWLREGDPMQVLAMQGAALEVVPGVAAAGIKT
jgi:uroporphyrin-III C-methyltransferase/precorrin-2 dehydrogenase/sirohydrochlorin ferrochelatase